MTTRLPIENKNRRHMNVSVFCYNKATYHDQKCKNDEVFVRFFCVGCSRRNYVCRRFECEYGMLATLHDAYLVMGISCKTRECETEACLINSRVIGSAWQCGRWVGRMVTFRNASPMTMIKLLVAD